MNSTILNYLQSIETERNIKILLACETGSRAWGFPSPDSDYDVRIIYINQPNWYLKLIESKDSIELMLDNNEIDISGWDLKKTLKLLIKSNAALLERIQSPILYKADNDFIHQINELSNQFYSPIATLHHYLGLSKNSFEQLKGKQNFKLKKMFYALRSACVCMWIFENPNKPPIEFQKVLGGISIDNSLKSEINDLIELKATVNESYLHSNAANIFKYIESAIDFATQNATKLPSANGNIELLNDFFIKTLHTKWT